MRGFAMAIGSSIPAFEISADYHDGDEEMSDDEDWSGDEDMDDLDESENDAEEHSFADVANPGNMFLKTPHALFR